MKSQTSSREITSSSREIASSQREGTSVRTGNPDIEHTAIILVGQHAHTDTLAALRRALSTSHAVYRRLAEVSSLPPANHYFFLLDEVDHAASGLLIEAVRSGSRVTLIANAFEPHFAA